MAADGLAEGESRPCWRRVASRAGLWGGRGATLAIPKALGLEVEGRLRGVRAAGPGREHYAAAHGEPRWGAGRAEPTLPGKSTPSWPGVAKSANRAASWAVFAFPLEGGGDVSWRGPRLLLSNFSRNFSPY